MINGLDNVSMKTARSNDSLHLPSPLIINHQSVLNSHPLRRSHVWVIVRSQTAPSMWLSLVNPQIVGLRFFFFSSFLLSKYLPAAGAVVTVDRPSTFYRSGGSKQLVEIIKKKQPKGHRFRFPQLWQFPQRHVSVDIDPSNSRTHFHVGLVVKWRIWFRPPSIRARNRPEHPMQHARLRVWQPVWGG